MNQNVNGIDRRIISSFGYLFVASVLLMFGWFVLQHSGLRLPHGFRTLLLVVVGLFGLTANLFALYFIVRAVQRVVLALRGGPSGQRQRTMIVAVVGAAGGALLLAALVVYVILHSM